MGDFLSKILVATDGSEDAALAARAAADLSERTGARLHAVHARLDTRDREEAQDLLEAGTEEIATAGGTVAGAHLRQGRPAEAIVDLAEELEADLVVVGSRGLGTAERLITGSVSEGVVHLARRPVLIARGGEGAWPPGRVVIGDDFSADARRAGELAAGMCGLLGARALVAWVYPATMTRARRAAHVQMISTDLMERGERSLRGRASELERALGTRPEVRATAGDVAAEIQEAAEEGGEPALVAVGSRGLDAVRRFLLGSVSTDVLRAVEGPVLIVPSPSKEPQR